MKADLSGPADTSMMGIVHRALRRDLARARAALTADRLPADDQRVAIAEHLGWLMQFLHRHHESEDAGLYPLVRRRSPAAAISRAEALLLPACRSANSNVLRPLSSTNSTSPLTTVKTGPSRASSAATLPDSSRVGTSTHTCRGGRGNGTPAGTGCDVAR